MSASRSRRGARVTIQLPEDARDQLRDLAKARGVKLSALLRQLALDALAQTEGGAAPEPPVPDSPEEMRQKVLDAAFKAAAAGDVQAMRMVLLELRQPKGPMTRGAGSSDDEDDAPAESGGAVLALRRRAAAG